MRRLPAFAVLVTRALGARASGVAPGATEHSCGDASASFDAPQDVRTFFGNSGTRVRCTKGAKRVRFFCGT